MSYTRCWLCSEWTRDDLMELVEIEGKSEKVCLACVENLNSRDRNLEGKKSAAKRQRDLSSLAAPADGRPPGNEGDSQSKGPESERMGSRDDSPTSEPPRKDQCFTKGCGRIATYSQTFRVREGSDGATPNGTIRRCQEHKDYIADMLGFELVKVQMTG